MNFRMMDSEIKRKKKMQKDPFIESAFATNSSLVYLEVLDRGLEAVHEGLVYILLQGDQINIDA